MRLVSVICLLLCVFLVSQNLENRKQLSRINNRITRLEKSMESADSVNVLKADALLEKARAEAEAGKADEALKYINRARTELGKKAASEEARPPETDEELAGAVKGFLKGTLK